MTRPFGWLRAGSRLRMPLAVTASAVVVAACSSSAGGTGPYGAAPSSAPAARASAAGGAALALRHTAVGTILTTGQGFTVYAFEADHGTTSACTGACAAAWPPVTASNTRITVTGGATRSLAGETTRPRGVYQLTYAGHPLYTFAGDASPGATNGQGSEAFGARWDVLTPAGQEVTGG
jgi:predicted lipoprotein with Yx(FWY)xxD motif